ncbi:MAG: PPC domain-containing protein [Cyanobacteria bacterium P01_F01_bin.150]
MNKRYLASEQDLLVGSVLGQFNVLEAEITGGTFPVPDGNEAGFFFTITEQTASITVSVFDELTVPGIDPFAVQEGILALDFTLQPQAGYTIDPDASEFSLTIADNLDSKNQVILSGEPETLVESEGTVGVHTFTVSDALPTEGITVSVSAPDLSEFDLAAIEVAGGSIAAVRDNSFDFTITEQIATIGLPVLDDGVAEGSETATFTLEPGDTYEVNQQATEATFILADTVDEVSVPEEIEGNDTLAEANALGLSVESPSAFVTGFIAGDFYFDPSEDVDFYTFNLEAGQTISLDIDAGEWNTFETFEYTIVYPALDEVQLTDTELRLFDAEGNELAANNDGAAPGEEFSRDPYLEFTAETAGTYYVGVSALGNRNYDPFTSRSGSAWTFPEVGVFYGPYELTATLTDGDRTPEPTRMDFETSSQGSLSAGDIVTDQFDGLTIEAADDLTAMIFDSANPTGGDSDLASSTLGNILIISEDGDSADPDDNAKGGTLMFDWEGVVNVESLGLLDIEEAGGMVTLYGSDDTTVLAKIDIHGLGDNSVQSLNIGTADVGKMDVLLGGSGAITEIVLSDSKVVI